MTTETRRASLLISSCDAFSDCWSPYFHGLSKYWPDCPYQAYVVSNFKECDAEGVKAITVGSDRGWTRNTRKALDALTVPYVIYTHEDFWIKSPVDTRAIERYLSVMEKDEADYIRLYPCPVSEFACLFRGDESLAVLGDTDRYRASLQMAIWRRQVLLDLLAGDENPWEFEIRGSVRSRIYGARFLGVIRQRDESGRECHSGIDYVCTAVNKGRWSEDARRYAKAEGLQVDFSNRPLERWWHRTTLFGRCENAARKVRKVVRAYIPDRPNLPEPR